MEYAIRLYTYEYMNIKNRRMGNRKDREILLREGDISYPLLFLVKLFNVTESQ